MYVILEIMQRQFDFSEGEYYHVYNRGTEKRNIFLDEKDKQRFMRLLYVSNGTRPFVFRDVEHKPLENIDRGKPIVAIGAYVLMSNHFHLLIKEIKEGGISAFMEKLLTGYASYFNKRNKRTGSLFQGPYRAQHADKDEYLKYLFAYIHLNPMKLIEPRWRERGIGIRSKSKAKHFLREYAYSSYDDYIRKPREEAAILTMHEFPEYFPRHSSFEDFLDDWMTFQAFGQDT